MQDPPTSTPPVRGKRVEFIDLLRGWAVIVMIETHVFNATLVPEITDSSFFQVLKFINGLVAPSFLFASGMAYAVTTRRKLNDYLSFGMPLFRQVGRLLFVMLIGYSLHIPKFNYYHLRYESSPAAWQVFWQADVLQCIAVSLLILQAMLLLLRSERRLYTWTAGLAVAVLLAAPLMWGIDFWMILPAPVAAYMNGLHYSLFPLFPWSAFLFGGAVAGYAYLRAGDAAKEHPDADPIGRTMRRISIVAVTLMVVSFVLHPIAAAVYTTYDYWRFSPSFALLRLGIVLLLCGGMFLFERRRSVSPNSVVTLIGRESLLVYTVHLLLVYGKFGSTSFAERVNNTFGYGEAAAVTIVLFLLMSVLALAWSRIKKGPARLKRTVQGLVLAGFALVFFFGPN
ncbi:MAG: heparan-alpha-glucosaminide N-acetyltransferase domain-containing protein [Bacteroidota bacterium]